MNHSGKSPIIIDPFKHVRDLSTHNPLHVIVEYPFSMISLWDLLKVNIHLIKKKKERKQQQNNKPLYTDVINHWLNKQIVDNLHN